MRLLAPLLPAWVVGLWLLLTSEALWSPLAPAGTGSGDEIAGGWVLVVLLPLGTVCYLAAPFLGRNLAVSTVSSTLAGLGSPNATQESFGAGVVRVATLAALYLLIVGFAAVELRG